MSKIGGKIREESGFSKKVGLFVGKVVAVNPTKEEFVSLLGYEEQEDAKDPVYTGESKEGNPYVRLDFWIRDTKSDFQKQVTFFLEDKVRQNRDETKTQYINDIGVCSWAEDEGDLPEWFVAKNYREAKVGEEPLYSFLRVWLGKIDFYNRVDPAELVLNWKKLMQGNVSELTEQINGDYSTSFVSVATVVTKEIDDEVKEFQGIYNGAFAPEYCMKHYRAQDFNDDMVLANIEIKPFRERKTFERFIANIAIGDYACKDFYRLSELEDYDPSLNVVASDDTLTEDSGSPSY